MNLQITNLSKTYSNGVQALKNVTLTIPQGMYGLLGPNGAGKSTLMRMLATLQEPDEGNIHLGDIDVMKKKEEVRRTLGYLPQEFSVYPKAKAEELLDYFAVLKGFSERKSRREVVEALLRKTNLWEVRKQKLGGYSGGMRQRFGVAVALLGNPKLLIVDEPTAGLDPAERVRFLNLLSELIVEQPGNFMGMGVDGSGVITGGEGFFLLDPKGDGFDAMFEIVAHEMGHQWWGVQLKPAFAEGGGVISESLAWYSAMQLVKNVKSREALRRFMSWMRQPNPWPPFRTGLPLLRAMDPWANYRKGPYAIYALSEYVGEARVNAALRTLVKKKASSLATTINLYRELQAVTPDSVKPLLHDLFEVNAFWTFDTKQVMAKKTASGTWQVTLEVEAHKIVADSAGVENEMPVIQWVEIGMFAAAEPGEILGMPLYVRKHFIRSGTQTIVVMLPHKPARGGIDPYSLLDWEEGDTLRKCNFDVYENLHKQLASRSRILYKLL
ncbi:MAG: ATP-binding cassette domain-containing protein [Chitinophagaceae bacterium]